MVKVSAVMVVDNNIEIDLQIDEKFLANVDPVNSNLVLNSPIY